MPGDRNTLDPKAPGRVIYLTFDDGPSPTYTPQVLNLLKRFNAKATFFLVGQNVNSYPALSPRSTSGSPNSRSRISTETSRRCPWSSGVSSVFPREGPHPVVVLVHGAQAQLFFQERK